MDSIFFTIFVKKRKKQLIRFAALVISWESVKHSEEHFSKIMHIFVLCAATPEAGHAVRALALLLTLEVMRNTFFLIRRTFLIFLWRISYFCIELSMFYLGQKQVGKLQVAVIFCHHLYAMRSNFRECL